jgi:hypothetical protein
MADLKISQLGPISESDVVSTDVLPVADVSADQTKKISSANLVKAGARLNTGAVTFGGDLIVTGDLNVNGTTTTIDTQNLLVEDKNVVIGNVASPTDVTANGGGITLKGTTDKTLNWVDSTDSWTSSENVDLASGKSYRINNASVLDSTTLGSGVVNSSLTSIGTVTTGTWSASTIAVDKGGTGQTSYTDGQILIGNSTGNTLTKSTLTAGTGVTITNGNGSITINATGSGGTVTSVTGTSPIASSGGTTPNITIQDGTTSQKGAVQLENSTSSTSTTKAATPSSVKTAYDLASAALPLAGGTLTGALGVTAGSATAPSVFISGDTNTGIYSPGADQVAISTNGVGRLFIDASGQILDGGGAAGLSFARSVITANPSDSTESAVLQFRRGATAPSSGDLGSIRFTDLSNYRGVSIAASIESAWSAGVSHPSCIIFSTTNSGNTTESEKLRITSNGRVGIGTTSPGYPLDVNGIVNVVSGSNGRINLGATTNYLYGDSAGNLIAGNSGGDRVQIDASGRLLVGTSTAGAEFHFRRTGSTNATMLVDCETGVNYVIQARFASDISGSHYQFRKYRGSIASPTVVTSGDFIGSTQYYGYDGTNIIEAAAIHAQVDGTPGANDMPGRLVFSTTADGASSPTERMRINNNGNVSIGTNGSTARLDVLAGSQVASRIVNANTDDLIAVKGNSGNSSSSSMYVLPMRFGDDTLRGSIYWNGSTVAYNTTSDYRLKENITAYSGALEKLSQLKPVTYNFLDAPDTILEGFIAHEVQVVVPNAVSGVKDEVDTEGNPLYQGLDTSKLVPLLTAALQEAIAKIKTQGASIAALEAKVAALEAS